MPAEAELAAAAAPDLVFLDLRGANGEEVLRDLAHRIATARPQLSRDELEQGLIERERLGSTALGGGVAAPHCRLARLQAPLLALGLHRRGVPFDAPDGSPVRVFVVIATPAAAPGSHLQLLAGLSRRLRETELAARILSAESRPQALDSLLGPHSLEAAS